MPQEQIIKGSGGNRLHRPCGVVILPDDSVACAEWAKHRVSVFKTDGSFRWPISIYSDNRGLTVGIVGTVSMLFAPIREESAWISIQILWSLITTAAKCSCSTGHNSLIRQMLSHPDLIRKMVLSARV